jgi:transcriptional regulator with XRE-family HTH domain
MFPWYPTDRLDGEELMGGERDEISDRAFTRVLGQEIRRAREARGWTRADLAGRLPSGIGDRTLLSYEHGIRALTVSRYIEICATIGVSAGETLDLALEKARDPRAFSFKVDLRAILRDERAAFEPVRFWARNRLRDNSNAKVLLAPVTVREMAAAFGFTHAALAAYFVEFTAED